MEPGAKARFKQLRAAPGQPWYQDDEPYEGAWHLSLKDDCGDDYISGYISIVPLKSYDPDWHLSLKDDDYSPGDIFIGPHEFVRRWGVVYEIDKEEDINATPWCTDRPLFVSSTLQEAKRRVDLLLGFDSGEIPIY